MSSKIPPEKLNVAKLYSDYLKARSEIDELEKERDDMRLQIENLANTLSKYRRAVETLIEGNV